MDIPDQTTYGSGTLWAGVLAAERQRILAASGWEREPERREVLQELLQEHTGRIYLHEYAETRKRALALEKARHALLRAARSLSRIPEGCSLSAWIFLDLADKLRAEAECPEPWHVLYKAEIETDAPWLDAGKTDIEFDAAAFERHLDAHPRCRSLLDAYRRYLALPSQLDLPRRAGLDQADEDLQRFLCAQFCRDEPLGGSSRRSLRGLFPPVRMRVSRWIGLAVAAVAVILGMLFIRAWFSRQPQWTESDATITSSLPEPAPPSVQYIAPMEGSMLETEGDHLVFRWARVQDAEGYQLVVLTAKLDTVYVSGMQRQSGVRVSAESIRGAHESGHYLFRVDGVREGDVIASTGLKPFRLE